MPENTTFYSRGNPFVAIPLGLVFTLIGYLVGFVQFARIDLYSQLQSAPHYSGPEDKNYWKILRRAYLHGNPKTLFLNEKHLNDWALGSFTEGTLSGRQSFLYNAWPKPPLFKIGRSQVSILLPIKVSALGVEREKPLLLQVSGVFVKKQSSGQAADYTFVPKTIMLGAATLPNVDWVRDFFLEFISQVFVDTQEYRELHPVWLKMINVAVSGDRLILTQS